MAEMFLGESILQNRAEFDPTLPDEFFHLIDPNGLNVVQDKLRLDGGYLVECLLKLNGRELPLETSVIMSDDIYHKIVFEIDVDEYTRKVH